jgi:hypothetical protein
MQCDKIRYETYAEALKFIKGIHQRKQVKDGMKVYKCTDCGGFHMHTMGKGKLKRSNKKEKYRLKPEDVFKDPRKKEQVAPVKKYKQREPPKNKQPALKNKILSSDQARLLKSIINNQPK